MKSLEALNPRQRAFCRHYIEEGNGTRSARKAGYKDKNAAVQANALLNNPKIKQALADLEHERSTQVSITMAEIEREVRQIALTAEKEQDRLRAYDMLVRIQGGYAAEKREITGELRQPVDAPPPPQSYEEWLQQTSGSAETEPEPEQRQERPGETARAMRRLLESDLVGSN